MHIRVVEVAEADDAAVAVVGVVMIRVLIQLQTG
jgi:hypothetical protein